MSDFAEKLNRLPEKNADEAKRLADLLKTRLLELEEMTIKTRIKSLRRKAKDLTKEPV